MTSSGLFLMFFLLASLGSFSVSWAVRKDRDR